MDNGNDPSGTLCPDETHILLQPYRLPYYRSSKNPHTAPDRPTHYQVPQLGLSQTLTLPPTQTCTLPAPQTLILTPKDAHTAGPPQTHRPLGCTPLGLDEAFTGTWQPGKGALLGAWLGAFPGSSLLPAVSTPT